MGIFICKFLAKVLLVFFRGETYFVVPEFRVLGCLNWKTACTSWRHIMRQNSVDERLTLKVNFNVWRDSHMTSFKIKYIPKN